jgi:arylsulfatase
MNSDVQPNIILICSDEHRTDTIGAYGSKICRTPNLDRLAARGVVMERCFAQNPVCMPSRATIQTGLLSRNHGLMAHGYGLSLSRDVPTIADILKSAGYRTVAVGKTHLSPWEEGVPEAPHYGFDELDSTDDMILGPYFDWVTSKFPAFEGYVVGTLFVFPGDHYWKGRRDLRKEYLKAREKYVRPLEISDTCNWGFGHHSPMPEEAHQNRWITQRAIARLEQHDANNPLLLWVGYVDPHNPFDPPPRLREMYRAEEMEEPVGLELDESLLPPHTRANRAWYRRFTRRDWRMLRALYYGSVTFMDEHIGQLLDAVERKLDMRNTIVVFLSDHGEHLGDHGIFGKHAYHYDASIRVPCIVRWDGKWQADRRSQAFMELTDLAPTILEAAGVKPSQAMDGLSFAPLLAGENNAPPRDHVYVESYGGGPEDPTPPPLTWARTIRTARWRVTFYPNASHGELHDLETDPHELRNLWFEPAYRAVLEDHRKILLDRLVMADFPIRRQEQK